MTKLTPLSATIAALFIASQAQAGTVTSKKDDLIIDTSGGFSVETADGEKTFKIGGRLQWDYDDTNSDNDAKDSKDMDVRRARLALSGKVNDWSYKAQFNLNNTSSDVEDLYIRYTGFGKKANVTVGKQREPFGLEDQTSSNDIAMLERSALTEVYAPGRNAGVQLHGKSSNWTYGIGLFESDGDANNTAISGRVTFTPMRNDDSLVHLGAGFTSRSADAAADESDVFGLEAAYVAGPFHAQFEYFDGEMGTRDVDGYYGQIGYVLTGEMRPYKDGVFKRVAPAEKGGAWEVVVRYEDGYGKYSDVGLGTDEGSQTSFGVNYYANKNVRLGMSYMDGETDSNGLGGKELRARIQFTF